MPYYLNTTIRLWLRVGALALVTIQDPHPDLARSAFHNAKAPQLRLGTIQVGDDDVNGVRIVGFSL